MKRKIWVILLAVFLIVYGILAVTNITLVFAPYVLGALALATAVFLILDR